MKPKISVIVPVYNVERYIKECLDSLVSQTLKDIEVIIVNDGTTDKSAEIAQKYVYEHKNFYIYHKENGGLGDARNYGLNHAKGKYIMFLDSDDRFTCNACELLYKKAEETKSDIVIGRPVWKGINNLEEPIDYLDYWFNTKVDDNLRNNDKIAIGIPVVWNKIFSTQLIKDNNIKFPCIIAEDNVFSVYTFYYANKITLINDVVYWRTERNDDTNKSITQVFDLKAIKDRITCMELIQEFCDCKGLSEIKKYSYHILNTINSILFRISDLDIQKNAFMIIKSYLSKVDDDICKKWIGNILGIGLDLILEMSFEEYFTHPSNKYEYIRLNELRELKKWIDDLNEGKKWIEGQLRNYSEEVDRQNEIIQKQIKWISELNEGKKWLEEQLENYKEEVNKQNKIIQEQKIWISELEIGKNWLQSQLSNKEM